MDLLAYYMRRRTAGGGIQYAADFIALAGALGVLFTTSQQHALHNLEMEFKNAGLLHRTDRGLSKLKVWYPVVGGTSTAHQLNFVDPAAFPLTFYGSPVHSNAGGIAWNGVNQYADTGYNVNAELGGALPPDGAALHYYSLDTNSQAGGAYQGDVYEIGAYDSWQFLLSVQNGAIGEHPFGRAYTGNNNDLVGTGTDGRGLFSLVRTPSDATQTGTARIYRNAVQVAAAQTGGYATNARVYLGALNIGNYSQYGYSSRRCAGAGISVAFTTAEEAAFYQAVQTFNTTLTRAV